MQAQVGEMNFDNGTVEFEEITKKPVERCNQYDLFAGLPELWDYRRLMRRRRAPKIAKEQGVLAL